MMDLFYPLLLAGIGTGGSVFIPSASGTNNYIVSSEDIDEYYTGLSCIITFTNANTGNTTLNINGLGAKPVLADNNVQLKAGDILAGSTHFVVYDGTRFKLMSQRAILSAAQLGSALTGLSRNLGTTQDIAASDNILTSIAKALTLASTLAGYQVGSDAVLASSDTVRAALGKLQGQINRRIRASDAISGYAVGANTALAAADSWLTALGKLQGQINARISTAIKSIQTGTFSHTEPDDGEFDGSVPISYVDPSKSIVVMYGAKQGAVNVNSDAYFEAPLYAFIRTDGLSIRISQISGIAFDEDARDIDWEGRWTVVEFM